MKKGLVLSSGGVDSTTCVSLAVKNLGRDNVSTVSVYYGQKHDKELKCAEKIADYYGVDHCVLDFTNVGIFDSSNCSLLKKSTQKITHGSYADQIKQGMMVSTYVPFRNGLMLSAIASLALSKYPDDDVDIYLGVHKDDAVGSAYADCSEEFVLMIGKAIEIGTYNKVHLVAPLVNINKVGVVKLGLELGTPYKFTWSCYEGGEHPCGICGTCIDRARAFAMNGVKDPALYGGDSG